LRGLDRPGGEHNNRDETAVHTVTSERRCFFKCELPDGNSIARLATAFRGRIAVLIYEIRPMPVHEQRPRDVIALADEPSAAAVVGSPSV
jgi:hypothetical protein